MGYLYETHMHTCLSSACGVSTGKEHVRFYKERGYTGIIMTDHFSGAIAAFRGIFPGRSGWTCSGGDMRTPWRKG